MNWREYEQEVFEELRRRYPDALVTRDTTLPGRMSQTSRQIDVLIEAHVFDTPIRIVVDAKRHGRSLDVNDVESFVSMIADVGAHRGLLVSSSGYTAAAAARAHRETNQDIELDVLTLEELKHLQGTLALPFSGAHGVVLPAPFGWVVDAQRREGAVACLYQRGYDLQAAGQAKEWMYLNFWHKDSDAPDLDGLLKLQSKTLHDATISYFPGVERRDARTAIRLAEVPGCPTPEYTGFVEFSDFIFFAVLFTTPEMSKRNVRKLREILRTVVPMTVRHV
ncbi:MAG: restriction endonuclease [Devosia sp.]